MEGARPTDPGRASRVALVGETFDQVRDVMIFGESGIIACCPPRPRTRMASDASAAGLAQRGDRDGLQRA